MKTVLKLGLAVALAAGSSAYAGDDAKATDAQKTKPPVVKKAKKTQVTSPKQNDGVLLTGSYIKQDLNHYGRITDGFSQVIVFDRKSIEQSGASDLKRFLGQQGIR
jgi:hypothetical protein